jgi:hypothetical protein
MVLFDLWRIHDVAPFVVGIGLVSPLVVGDMLLCGLVVILGEGSYWLVGGVQLGVDQLAKHIPARRANDCPG